MAFSVQFSNNSYHQQSFDRQAIKETVKNIVANAETKVSNYSSRKIGIDLYNGQLDALTARQIAISNSGLDVKIDGNLKKAVNFLKVKAAVNSVNAVKTNVVPMTNNSNPFADLESKKASSDFLFIKAA